MSKHEQGVDLTCALYLRELYLWDMDKTPNIGLVGIDVDGTLVGKGNHVRDDVWEALEQARQAGIRLSVCSGRPALGNALQYAQRIDGDGWHIFQNGASIVNVHTQESLSETFPDAFLAELVDIAEHENWLLEVYSDREWAVTQKGDYAERHAQLLGIPYQPKRLDELQGQPVRAQWVVPRTDQKRLLSYPHTGLTLHPAGSPAMPDVMFVSVTVAGVCKASALTRVSGQYGLELANVLMVGDGENDISALQKAGHSIAMGNAGPQVKAAAQRTVSPVDEGGLREALHWAIQMER